MAKTQKNKATSYHLGQLKAKLAKLKRELLTPTSSGGGGGCKWSLRSPYVIPNSMSYSWLRRGENRCCQCRLYRISLSREEHTHE